MCSAYKVLINSETKWYTMIATLLQCFVSPEENNCCITFHFLSRKFKCIYKFLLVCLELHKCMIYLRPYTGWCGIFVTQSLPQLSFRLTWNLPLGNLHICNCQNLSGQDAKLKAIQLYIQMYYVCGIAYISKCP